MIAAHVSRAAAQGIWRPMGQGNVRRRCDGIHAVLGDDDARACVATDAIRHLAVADGSDAGESFRRNLTDAIQIVVTRSHGAAAGSGRR